MYFRGRLTIHLTGTTIHLTPPRNFFGGVANLFSGGRWEHKDAVEFQKLMAFAQSTNRALSEMGVRDIARISLGSEVIYEDLQNQGDDFAAAFASLQARLSQGMEPDPRIDFDMVLKHDDGVIAYVIDLDFLREHPLGQPPVTIQVSGVPSELRKLPGEDDVSFRNRINVFFHDQYTFDATTARWSAQFEAFLNQLADHFRVTVGADDVNVEFRKILPRHRDTVWLDTYSDFGYPLYGYDPLYDLAYLSMWDSMWMENQLIARDLYYGDFGAPYVYIGDNGWGYNDFNQFDASYVAPPMDGGGGYTGGEWASPSGGGGDVSNMPVGSDSGGGGWVNNISDWGSGGGGDTGGGGTSCSTGSSSCSGGASNCSSSSSSCGGGGSSCGGGGCSSG